MNRGLWKAGFLLLFFVCLAAGQASKPSTAASATKPKPASFIDEVLDFLGISDSPSTLKAPGDEVKTGQLWVVQLDSQNTHAIANGSGYRSPVFVAGSKDVMALKGTEVWLFSTSQAKRLYPVEGITKLVASSARDPDKILVLLANRGDAHDRVGLLSISSGRVTPQPYDATSTQDLRMVESLEGWERVYGDERLYVKRVTKQVMSVTKEWADVFLKTNGRDKDISQCDGTNCGQPSMSSEGRLVVFVKADSE